MDPKNAEDAFSDPSSSTSQSTLQSDCNVKQAVKRKIVTSSATGVVETYIEILAEPTTATPTKKRREDKEAMKNIRNMEDLMNTTELLQVKSRLCPRTTRSTDATPMLSVSGQQVADWVSPPEGMSLIGLQDNLRLSHTASEMKNITKIFKMIRQTNPVAKKTMCCDNTYFTKLHPADVRGLANSMKQMSVLTIPSSLKVTIPGVTSVDRQAFVNQAICVVDDIVRAMKTTDFNKVTHDGMSIVEASWEVIKTVLLNCDQ